MNTKINIEEEMIEITGSVNEGNKPNKYRLITKGKKNKEQQSTDRIPIDVQYFLVTRKNNVITWNLTIYKNM